MTGLPTSEIDGLERRHVANSPNYVWTGCMDTKGSDRLRDRVVEPICLCLCLCLCLKNKLHRAAVEMLFPNGASTLRERIFRLSSLHLVAGSLITHRLKLLSFAYFTTRNTIPSRVSYTRCGSGVGTHFFPCTGRKLPTRNRRTSLGIARIPRVIKRVISNLRCLFTNTPFPVS